MSQLPRSELAGILFQEIADYLPEIKNGISILKNNSADNDALTEIHRLFHNIKGAASQVAFTALSNSAALCETLTSDLLESQQQPAASHIDFLARVNEYIHQFCSLERKSPQAESFLLESSISSFNSLVAPSLDEFALILPENVQEILQQITSVVSTNKKECHDHEPDLQTLREECLESLRSIMPLLHELTECSIYNGIKALPGTVLQPMISALSTLAYCSRSAGLSSQDTLLSNFIDILTTLQRNPCLIDKGTLNLLQEFLSYLDLVLALPPSKSYMVTVTVQEQLSNVLDLLHEKSNFLPSAGIEDDIITEAISTLEIECTDDNAEVDFFVSDDPDLLEIFQEECLEHLSAINVALNTITSQEGSYRIITTAIRECIAQMRLSTHTLKGAAAMTGFAQVANSAYALEKLLDWLHDESSELLAADITIIKASIQNLNTLSSSLDQSPQLNVSGDSDSINEYLQQRIFAHSSQPSIVDEQHNNDVPNALSIPDELLIDETYHEISTIDDTLVPDNAICDDFFPDIDGNDIDAALAFSVQPSSEDSSTEASELSQEEIELLVIFQTECDEHLLVITTELNTLVTEVRTDREINSELKIPLARMRRAVHTLKGAAAMTGFANLASCAHSLEDLLDILHDVSPSISPADVTIIAEAIDTIELISQSPDTEYQNEGKSLTEQIQTHILHKEQHTPALPENENTEPDFHIVPDNLQDDDTILPADSSNIRVPLKDLEELVNIEGELVVARGSMERLLDKFSKSLEEFNTIKDTLRRKSQELEVGFEAQSLYGFGPASQVEGDTGPGDSALSEFDPIELDRYSQLNLIIRSLNEISIDVNAIHSDMTALESNMQGQVAKQQLAMGLMQEKLMRIRMTPLSSISRTLFRTVRQTAKQLNKDVQLKVVGEDVLMDRFIWSKTMDPLMHILRNCIDHGIEDAATREKHNKPASGLITFDASQHGRTVVLRISDDGRGIDPTRLREKLISDGIISASNSLNDQEILPYLFKPSVTTRENISQISGRGVGLDVVLRNIQDLRGKVQIINTPGKGVVFELNIPITLSVNRAVIIDLDSRKFAIPIQDITEVHKFKREEIVAGEQPHVLWNDKHIPVVELAPYLQLHNSSTSQSGDLLTLVINNGEKHVAMQIDSIEEQREVIIKDLGSHLRYVRGISGVTLTGEGSIIPILNLIELASISQPVVSSTVQAVEETRHQEPLKVLVVDDSISVRYSITRLVGSQSWEAYQAVDGIDALEKLETITPDLIILDIEMPRMNGYEFMSILRNRVNDSSIPVIMLTSRASDKHRKKAEELGVTHYMTKPFQEDDFIQLLKSFDANR